MKIPKFGDLGLGVIPNRPNRDNATRTNSKPSTGGAKDYPPRTQINDWSNPWSDTDTWQGSAV